MLHLATQCVRLSLFDPEIVHRVNAEGTLKMLMASVAGGIGRFVYVSSSEVFGTARTAPMSEDHPFDPTTVYGAEQADRRAVRDGVSSDARPRHRHRQAVQHLRAARALRGRVPES